MAGIIPDLFQETARGAALNINQVIKNYPLDEMSVFTPVKTSLMINAKTVRKVRYSPSLETLRTVNIINRKALQHPQFIP